MDESRKDSIEFVAAQGAAALLELVPGGSILSRALLMPVEMAERRRTASTLEAIAEDIQQLQATSRLPNIESLAASDAFMANLTEVVRATKATSDGEKRQLLRNALFNAELGEEPADVSEFFIRLVSRYSTLHVKVLRFIEPLPPYVSDELSYPTLEGQATGVMRDLPAMLRVEFPDRATLIDPVFRELRNDGLVILTQPQTYGLQQTGDGSRPDSISDLGRSFVSFLRNLS